MLNRVICRVHAMSPLAKPPKSSASSSSSSSRTEEIVDLRQWVRSVTSSRFGVVLAMLSNSTMYSDDAKVSSDQLIN